MSKTDKHVVAGKTKLLAWSTVGEKEKLDFDLFDFAPDQIAELNRWVRADGDAAVRITIEPEQKKLQIEPIKATVRLVSISCRSGGQKIKIAGFTSPDERATAMKRLCEAETPVVVTIEPVQGHLDFEADPPHLEAGTAEPPPDPQDIPIHIVCKGMKQAGVEARFAQTSDGSVHVTWNARLGNYHRPDDGRPLAGRNWPNALAALRLAVNNWLDDLQLMGKADARRAMEARRNAMREQVNEQLDAMIESRRTNETG